MKIGINWEALSGLSVDEEIALLRRYSFESIFLFSDQPSLGEVIKKLSEAGITCESCHAPFDGINRMWAQDESGDEMLERLKDGVRACAKHNIPVLTVHLSSGDAAPAVNDAGLRRFTDLIDLADEMGVQIAFENQRKLGNIAVAMERFPSSGFCWDVGHEKALSDGIDFMQLFGKRIISLHLHDNRALHNADDHLLPYEGKIDLESAAKRLAESGYDKAIMLEVLGNQSEAYRHLTPDEYMARARDAAKRFAERVEEWKETSK